MPNTWFNVSGRVEYISQSGSVGDGSADLLYGPGSNAWSFTLTPTYQSGIFFTRGRGLVRGGIRYHASGLAFGPMGTNTSQTRFAVEAGILF